MRERIIRHIKKKYKREHSLLKRLFKLNIHPLSIKVELNKKICRVSDKDAPIKFCNS
jgi:hypothetical protein